MTEAEYLLAQHLNVNPRFVASIGYHELYRSNGMDEGLADIVVSYGDRYKRIVAELPWSYYQLVAGEQLAIGGRRFDILTGGGHSSDQAMIFCRDENVFVAADQVMLGISPNVSVMPLSPDSDPLGQYLRSLGEIRNAIPEDALVLSGHNLPFSSLHQRIDELVAHHEERCGLIEQACSTKPCTAAELVGVLFRQTLDAHQMTFAFSETLAHINLMVRQGRLAWDRGGLVRLVIGVGS